MGCHGETYCLVGGYRAYGQVPMATPAKVEAEKPVPSRAPKRKRSPEKSDADLGCPNPQIRRLQHSSSLGLEGAWILQQGGPTTGRIPSAPAPVYECPIFAFSRSATRSPLQNKVPSHCHPLKGFPQCGSFLWARSGEGQSCLFPSLTRAKSS